MKQVKIEYEDSFVKIAGVLGGEDYVKVARALLNNEDATDEEIASATGLKINTVRKIIYRLFGRSLITGIRVRDPKRGWFVYRWRTQRDQIDGFISNQKKKALDKLRHRFVHEESHEFYHCGSPNCRKLTFEEGLDTLFKCPSCGMITSLTGNDLLRTALTWKIGQIEKEMHKA